MNKFIGLPYPVTKDAKGYFRSQHGLNQIKSDLIILIMTNHGERLFNPLFGANLRSILFEPNDPALRSRAREMIIKAIEMWEPRVSIDQIEVLTEVDTRSLDQYDTRDEIQGILMIRIMFRDPENMQVIEELKLEVPLGGAK